MPVVSRSGPAVDSLSEIQDVGDGPNGAENFAGEPKAATSMAEPPERVLAEQPDTPQPGGRAAAAAPLPLVVAPAAGQTLTAGGPAVQRSTADDGPAETALHGAEMPHWQCRSHWPLVKRRTVRRRPTGQRQI